MKGIVRNHLDTRAKIAGLAELPDRVKDGQWTAIVGLFDPLTAQQAERIAAHAQSGRNILAIVAVGENTLLSQEARAILIAALRQVQLVALVSDGWRASLLSLPNLLIDEDETAELNRSREFAAFILGRNGSGRA